MQQCRGERGAGPGQALSSAHTGPPPQASTCTLTGQAGCWVEEGTVGDQDVHLAGVDACTSKQSMPSRASREKPARWAWLSASPNLAHPHLPGDPSGGLAAPDAAALVAHTPPHPTPHYCAHPPVLARRSPTTLNITSSASSLARSIDTSGGSTSTSPAGASRQADRA